MIFVHKSESAIGLNAIRKIRVAAGDKHEVAFEAALGVHRPGAIDARVEAIVGTERGEKGAFGESFRGRGGDKHFAFVEGVDRFAGVEGAKLDTEIGARKFRAGHDFLDACRERIGRRRLSERGGAG